MFRRSAWACCAGKERNAQGALLRSVQRSPAGSGGPVLESREVRQALVTGCVVGSGAATFLRLYGMAGGDVALEANAAWATPSRNWLLPKSSNQTSGLSMA